MPSANHSRCSVAVGYFGSLVALIPIFYFICLNCVYYCQMEKMAAALEDLQNRAPEQSVEKASKATLQALLEYNDSFSQEVEHQHSSLTLQRQYALSLFRDLEVPMPAASQDDLPCLQEITAMQESFERYCDDILYVIQYN